MKKLIILLVLVFVASSAFAQIDLSVGATAGYNFELYHYENGATTIDMTTGLLQFGAFFDATYARLSVDYAMTLGKPYSIVLNGVAQPLTGVSTDYFKQNYIMIELIGKYPFDLGSVKIWPAVGIQYAYCLYLDYDGDGVNEVGSGDTDFDDLNDFLVVGGVGADISITDNIFLTMQVMFEYDLTPKSGSGIAATDVMRIMTIEAKFGGGYKF